MSARTRSARIVLTRRVRAGEEIFVSYGPEFWRGSHFTAHSTSNIPDWEWDISNPFASVPSSLSVPVLAGPADLPTTSTAVGTFLQAAAAVLQCRSWRLRSNISNFFSNPFSVVSVTLLTSFPLPESRPKRVVDFWRSHIAPSSPPSPIFFFTTAAPLPADSSINPVLSQPTSEVVFILTCPDDDVPASCTMSHNKVDTVSGASKNRRR